MATRRKTWASKVSLLFETFTATKHRGNTPDEVRAAGGCTDRPAACAATGIDAQVVAGRGAAGRRSSDDEVGRRPRLDRGGRRSTRRGPPTRRGAARDATARARRGDRVTAAAIVTHGSSGATGASEPSAEPRPAASSASSGEGPVGAPRPVEVGDVAVVHRVLGLHARDDPEPREPREVGAAQQLRVLDADPPQPTALERVERERVRAVADRVDGRHETRPSDARRSEPDELVGVVDREPAPTSPRSPGTGRRTRRCGC